MESRWGPILSALFLHPFCAVSPKLSITVFNNTGRLSATSRINLSITPRNSIKLSECVRMRLAPYKIRPNPVVIEATIEPHAVAKTL